MMEIGSRYLVTTDGWFWAPDGEQYKAAYGTLKGVHDSAEVLGVKTNARSTNWYITLGRMTIAGCQIHYVVRTDECSSAPPSEEIIHEGALHPARGDKTRIFFAD